MSIDRSGTAKPMMSRQWTTSEMFEGLSHILVDGKDELPDDLDHLEAGWHTLSATVGVALQILSVLFTL